jgi:hypothetical protein
MSSKSQNKRNGAGTISDTNLKETILEQDEIKLGTKEVLLATNRSVSSRSRIDDKPATVIR